MAKVLAWGVEVRGVVMDISTDRNDAVEAQRYAKGCPIIELVDKRELDKALVRIAELETNQTLQP